MRVVADTHALIWYAIGDPDGDLSPAADRVLQQAEQSEGIAVSVATLIDAWYLTMKKVPPITDYQVTQLQGLFIPAESARLIPVDQAVFVNFRQIPRSVLPDPWDRLIVATAQHLRAPLVTRDATITRSGLVPVIW